MKRIRKNLMLVGASLITLTIASPASALQFYFDGTGGFTDPAAISPTPPIGFPAPAPSYTVPNTYDTEVATYQRFSWGTPVDTQQSHLTINETSPDNYVDHQTGVVTVSDPIGATVGTLTHHNLPIDANTAPDFGDVAIHYHVNLFDDAAMTSNVFASGPLDFTLQLWETPNADNPCADGNANGVPPNQNGCADRLQYGPGWRTLPSGFSDAQIGSFMYNGLKYAVSFAGFYTSDGAGGLVPQSVFWTPENTTTTGFVQVEVHQVPEPGTLFLMALGLGSLAYVARRRRQVEGLVA
jgi:hypothetical protein